MPPLMYLSFVKRLWLGLILRRCVDRTKQLCYVALVSATGAVHVSRVLSEKEPKRKRELWPSDNFVTIAALDVVRSAYQLIV